MLKRNLSLAFAVATVVLAYAIGCTPLQRIPAASSQSKRCDGFDYGSGMVAMVLPRADADSVSEVHSIVESNTALLSDSPLARLPYRPHVSIIYNVTPESQAAITDTLKRWTRVVSPVEMTFGPLIYWDDTVGDKTTLAAQVGEPGSQILANLHQDLSRASGSLPRRPFHPHVTLAFLATGVRLPAATEQEISQRLASLHPSVSTIIVTEQCGTTIERFDID